MEGITTGLQKQAIEHILLLSKALLGAVVLAAIPPLTKAAAKYTTSLLARLSPTHENETIVRMETRHQKEELSHAGEQETEATVEKCEPDENEEHLQELRAIDRAIDMQQKSLEIKQRARETEDARQAEELATEQRLAQQAQQDKERKIEDARQAKGERERIQETERRRQATETRETEQRRLAEVAREAWERKGIEDARREDERRLAEEARNATERRLAQQVPRMEEWRFVIVARKAEERISGEFEGDRQTKEREIVKEALKAKEPRLIKHRQVAEVVAPKIEKQRLSDVAREMEEATKLNEQRIKIKKEITELEETMRTSEERKNAELRVRQQIGKAKEMTDPTTKISKEEFELAKKKIQFCPGQFRFAVSGVSGSGKSSLINMFLDLPDNHKDGARTDITETTFTIGIYPDRGTEPPRKSTVWHDLPGAGTSTFSHIRYFNDQCLFLFDLVLVVFDNRITEIDLEILRNCRLSKIPTFLIRSKADMHIRNSMKSRGYESDDDPEEVEVLRHKCRDHLITKTRESVEIELAKANLAPQRVYIVSCSKEFRKEYSAFISGSDVSNGKGRGQFVDEMELIHDLMVAASRRCDFQRMLPAPITPSSAADRDLLIGRLRTGQMKGIGVRIRCPCEVKKKDVEHILVKCSLTKKMRLQARKALGVKTLTRVGLLYQDEGLEWADKIWQTFIEERKALRSMKD